MFHNRCSRLASAIASDPQYAGRTVVLVGHAASVSSLIRALTGSHEVTRVNHTAVTELKLDATGELWSVVGDACSLEHLPCELRTE